MVNGTLGPWFSDIDTEGSSHALTIPAQESPNVKDVVSYANAVDPSHPLLCRFDGCRGPRDGRRHAVGAQGGSANPGPTEVIAFEAAGFAEPHQSSNGPVDVARLTAVPRASARNSDNTISGFTVGSGVRVLVFETSNFTGRCAVFGPGSYPDLSTERAGMPGVGNWNNRISSLRVADATSALSCTDQTGLQLRFELERPHFVVAGCERDNVMSVSAGADPGR